MCDKIDELLSERFWLVSIIGTALAMFGVIANALLTVLFLSRLTYRHSPFFFLGFVAFYDTLVDFTYIILLPVPTAAEYFDDLSIYNFWLTHVGPIHFFGQISKITSVFCLIGASIERYFMTRHWTFTGFGTRTRWIILIFVIMLAIFVKFVTSSDFVSVNESNCRRFQRYRVSSSNENVFLSGLFNALSIFLPFIMLIFLNGGIVLMLRRQHIQQLRSLITELTMGKDVMKTQRHNLRSATHTLIVIITVYLISNLLNMTLTLLEFICPALLHQTHQHLYQLASDFASVLTVLGNAIRCPAHVLSNRDIRLQIGIMLCTSRKRNELMTWRRRSSQMVDAPWLSLFLVPAETPLETHHETPTVTERLRRLSANVWLTEEKSLNATEHCHPQFNKNRRHTFCVGSLLKKSSNRSNNNTSNSSQKALPDYELITHENGLHEKSATILTAPPPITESINTFDTATTTTISVVTNPCITVTAPLNPEMQNPVKRYFSKISSLRFMEMKSAEKQSSSTVKNYPGNLCLTIEEKSTNDQDYNTQADEQSDLLDVYFV